MPPITEAKLYEAFGLTPPEGQGAQEQETAAPAAEASQVETTQGAQEQEVAVPAVEETEPAATESADDDGQEPAGEPEKQAMSQDERRANAARRRQQEQQAAIDKAVADAIRAEQGKTDAAIADIFVRAGLKNSFTGENITNMEQFNAWHQQAADAQLQRELKSGKLTAESLNQLIDQHPAVKQAQALVQQTAQAQKAQQAAADRAKIDGELAEIGKLNPEIKGVADLLNMPTAAQFKGYVDKGYSFLDAYKLANMDSMAEAKAQRAREAAQVNNRGKSHLESTGNSRGAGAAPVPSAQLALFRRLNPNATDAQIQKFYNNYLSRQGG